MKKTLIVNNLISFNVDGEQIIKRILYVDNGRDIAYLIAIHGESGLPEFYSFSELKKGFSKKELKLYKDDPYLKTIDEDTLSDKEKTSRDKSWEIIKDIVKLKNEPDIYIKKGRGPYIVKAKQEHGVTRKTVYKYLRRYWQRGKVKNALIPDFKNSGAKGVERKAGETKRGRKRTYGNVVEIGEGINVDESVKKIFRLAISNFYRNPKEISLQAVFDLMLHECFAEEYVYENGIKKPILIPAAERPTYRQFVYWYNKEKEPKSDMDSRKGKLAYDLTSRTILGDATSETFGPGSRFEIDATVGDVYLVSRYNPSWIIGRPVIYIIIDVFSRYITGLYIGLEGPSWIGAMMALANCVTNKQKFCLEYGISIEEETWNSHYLPGIILADGGELAGKPIEALANNLNLRIETASTGRGDLKGIVERNFRTVNEKVKPFIPGQVIKDAHKRRGNDYRLDGKLNIYQFTKIIVAGVLHHNQKKYLSSYKRDKEMILDEVKPFPYQLWEWGIRNRSGRLRSFPEDIVKLNLMPEGTAKITRSGIQFKEAEYSCEKAIREGWFGKGSKYDLEKLPVVYDPRKPEYIYLKSEEGRDFEKCYLLPTEDKYTNRHWSEIEYLQKYETLQEQINLGDSQQAKSDFASVAKSVVAEAEETHKIWADPDASKASRVANIRDNRAFEKEKNREEEGFELDEQEEVVEESTVIPFKPHQDDKETPDKIFEEPDNLKLLREIRQRKKRNDVGK